MHTFFNVSAQYYIFYVLCSVAGSKSLAVGNSIYTLFNVGSKIHHESFFTSNSCTTSAAKWVLFLLVSVLSKMVFLFTKWVNQVHIQAKYIEQQRKKKNRNSSKCIIQRKKNWVGCLLHRLSVCLPAEHFDTMKRNKNNYLLFFLICVTESLWTENTVCQLRLGCLVRFSD